MRSPCDFDADGVRTSSTTAALVDGRVHAGDFDADGRHEVAMFSADWYFVHEVDDGEIMDPAIVEPADNITGGIAVASVSAEREALLANSKPSDWWLYPYLLEDGRWEAQGEPLNTAACWPEPGGASADFNGDGRLDALVRAIPAECEGAVGVDTVTAIWSDAGGAWYSTPLTQWGHFLYPLDVDDHDGADLVAGTDWAAFSIIPGNGDGTFGDPVAQSVDVSGEVYGFSKFGDIDGDGISEGVLKEDGVTSVVRDLLGDPERVEFAQVSLTTKHLHDFNGDGIADFLATDTDDDSDSLLVYLSRTSN